MLCFLGSCIISKLVCCIPRYMAYLSSIKWLLSCVLIIQFWKKVYWRKQGTQDKHSQMGMYIISVFICHYLCITVLYFPKVSYKAVQLTCIPRCHVLWNKWCNYITHKIWTNNIVFKKSISLTFVCNGI